MNNFNTVIAAVSTPPGKGGVAIIRITGAGAFEVGDKIFTPRGSSPLSKSEPRKQIRGDIIYGGDIIDDGMATRFPAPNSYTGEDTVEIACHGGMLVTSLVLEAAFAAGAAAAMPGEFTKRAFINGKLTLTDAEAIGSLLEAESREQIKLSAPKARGMLSVGIAEIRQSLTSLLSSMYARIDYPDEDLGDFTDDEAEGILLRVKERICKLIATYKTGKAVSQGVKTTICGKPNVGKSTLYNLLLGRDAAIVTDIKGTTRDVLSEKIPLGRVMLMLSDTAGVREAGVTDPIEKIGIQRSRRAIEESELILAVFDGSQPCDSEDKELISAISKSNATKIAIINKGDLECRFDESEIFDGFDKVIRISAKESAEIARESLASTVNALFTDEKISVGEDAIISSARQNASLARALELVESALEAYRIGISQDAASSDVERALGAIAELDGRAVSEEVVADIFAKFCVGK
jgi:tRNA modification GTPase